MEAYLFNKLEPHGKTEVEGRAQWPSRHTETFADLWTLPFATGRRCVSENRGATRGDSGEVSISSTVGYSHLAVTWRWPFSASATSCLP